MTKKDFEFIAEVIRQNIHLPLEARRAIALAFSDALARQNPRFNSLRFVLACLRTGE